MINEALLELGYTEFIVRGDSYEGIEWMITPENIPSKETVLNKINELKELKKESENLNKSLKESAMLKLINLGLTEEEIKALIGGI
jgi:cell fate (sporulation/competence/biofilm development) regulator YmcA (YheA/YmcA/DUF963 family)